MKKFYFFLLSILLPFPIYSQWSGNPGVNTTICSVSGTKRSPLVVTTTDGGSYISWFDGRSGNLDVYIQRLNAQGIKQFAPEGLLVSSHPQSSTIWGHDLIADANNNAILVFTDERNGLSDSIVNPFAYKISPSGNFLWGEDGVTLTAQTNFNQLWTKAAISSDGSVFVAWRMTNNFDLNNIYVQKISESGTLQWTKPTVFVPSGKTQYIFPDIAGSDSGSAILSWAAGPIDTPRVGGVPYLQSIYSAKISSAGSVIWNKDVYTRYDLTIPPQVVPKIYSDGNNGAYFSWFCVTETQRVTSVINHISSSGNYLFTDTIAIVSMNHNGEQFVPYLTFNPSTDDIYTFWLEQTPPPDINYGVYGQKLSSAGTRLWSDSGKVFVPLSVAELVIISVDYYSGNAIVGYQKIGGHSEPIKSFSVNESGSLKWGIIDVSNVESVKQSTYASMTSNGMTIYSWEDNREGSSGIYTQNVNADGTLGPVGINTISSNVPGVFVLYQNYPNPFNPSTNIRFNIPESGMVSLKIFSIAGKEIATLFSGNMQPGEYSYQFSLNKSGQAIDNYQLSSGVYFYTLKTEKFSETKRMVLLK